MTPFVRRLSLLVLTATLLAVATVRPAAANHGRLSATRSPAGGVSPDLAVTITATIENADAVLALDDATLDVPLDPLLTPYISLIPGTVTAVWRETGAPVDGTITSGNDPGDTAVSVHINTLPPGQHADVSFGVRVAHRLPAGAEDTTAQLFLTYVDGAAQSIPWYMKIPLLAEPALALTKTDGGARYGVPGPSAVRYELVPENRGNQDATGVVLTDTVPPGTHFDPGASSPAWSCSPNNAAGATCTLTVGDLGVGAVRSYAFQAVLDAQTVPAGLDDVRNTARVRDDGTNTTGSDVPKQASAFVDTPVLAAPDLTLAKSDGGASVAAGGRVVYTLDYANAGSQDATGVVLHETVPDHSTLDAGASNAGWSCSPAAGTAGAACTLAVGDLAAGSSGTAAFAVRAAAALPAGVDELINAATITDDGANGGDLDPTSNRATDTTPLLAAPDLGASKVDGDVTAHPGETFAYGITVRNGGDQAATGVVIEETVPDLTRFDAGGSDGGWTCAAQGAAGAACTFPVRTVAAGASVMATFSVTVDATVPAGIEQLVNTATVHDDGANGPDPTPDDNSATEPTPLAAVPDLALAKDDGGATVRPGETLGYTLTYRNRGDQGATGVTLRETLPDHTTFAPGASAAGWTCSAGGLAPKALKAERIQHTSSLKAERIQHTNSLKAERIQRSAGSHRAPGLTGRVGASSSGAVCTLTIGDLAAGASGSAAFAVTLDGVVPAGLAELTNTATLLDDGTNGDDPTPGDDTATETTPIVAAPVLSLTKSDSGSTARPGETVLYSLAFANDGDRDAAGAVLEETVPEHTRFAATPSDTGWTCTPTAGTAGSACTLDLGTLAAGSSGAVVFAVTVADPLPDAVDHLLNTATLRDGAGDEASAQEATPVARPAGVLDLAVTKTDGGSPVAPGDQLVYTITARNAGDLAASGVAVEETVPDGTAFVADASDPSWTCTPADPAGAGALEAERIQETEHLKAERIQDTESLKAERIQHTGSAQAAPAGSTCTATVGALAAGESRELRFTVTVAAPLPAGTDHLVNTATVHDDGSAGPDADPSNNQASVTTPVVTLPGGPDLPVLDAFLSDALAEDRDGSGGVSAGDVIAYSVRITNAGPGAAQGVVFAVPGLAHLEAVAGSVRGEGASELPPDGAALRVAVGDLPEGATAGFAWDAAIASELPAALRAVQAQGEVTAQGIGALPSDDPDTPAPDDPTRTPLTRSAGPGEPVGVPTLSEWGLLLLTIGLSLTAWWVLR